MGILNFKLMVCATTIFVASSHLHAQDYVEVDEKLAGYIISNTAFAEGQEVARNNAVKHQEEIQDSIRDKIATIAAIKEVATLSYSNVKAFGWEYATYKRIALHTQSIWNKVAVIKQNLGKWKMDVYILLSLNRIINLYTSVQNAYHQICQGNNDGRNWIKPSHRINLAHKILIQLSAIETELDRLILCYKFIRVTNVVRFIDRESYYKVLGMKAVADQVKWQWKSL